MKLLILKLAFKDCVRLNQSGLLFIRLCGVPMLHVDVSLSTLLFTTVYIVIYRDVFVFLGTHPEVHFSSVLLDYKVKEQARASLSLLVSLDHTRVVLIHLGAVSVQ